MKFLTNWFRGLFKSRAQKDRERGYYKDLRPLGARTDATPEEALEELNRQFDAKYKRVGEVHQVSLYPTFRSRWRAFRQHYGWPNPKELLMLLFPSRWLSEKLWPRWDPEDRNAKKAPAAGYYDADTGTTYCADGRVVQKKLHVPGM